MAPGPETNPEKSLSGNESVCPICGTGPFFGNICTNCVEEFKKREKPSTMTGSERAAELALLLEDAGESGHKALGAQMFYQRVRELVGRPVSEAETENNTVHLIREASQERTDTVDTTMRSEAAVDEELQEKKP